MQLGTQIYSSPKLGQKGTAIQINYNLNERGSLALNFTGFAYVDTKYKLVKNLIQTYFSSVIVTDNDLIAFDDYIQVIDKTQTVVLVYNKGVKHSGGWYENNAFGTTCGASLKRLQKAKIKLQERGIKVKLFTSEKTCLNFLARQK